MGGGAASGAFLSQSDDLSGTAIDAAAGAVTGKIGDVALTKVADFVKPVIAPAIRRMADAGVRLTPGQIKGGRALVREDKRMSKPIVGDMIADARRVASGDWNLATVAKVVGPLGIKPPPTLRPGHDAVAWAQDAVGAAYNKIVPKLTVKVDGRFMVGMKGLAEDAQQLPPEAQKQFAAIVKRTLGRPGALTGRGVKDAQGELGRLASNYSTSTNAYERELGRVLSGVKTRFDDMIVRQNPGIARELSSVNEAFRGLATVETAAAKGPDGLITPAQLKLSARMADQSRRKSQSARGTAFMQDWAEDGARGLSGNTPDSGTAGRMQQGLIAQLLGGIDAIGYKADGLLSDLSLAPRPAVAGKVRQGLLTGKRGVAPVAIASTKDRKH
jgi:hypothetical protein